MSINTSPHKFIQPNRYIVSKKVGVRNITEYLESQNNNNKQQNQSQQPKNPLDQKKPLNPLSMESSIVSDGQQKEDLKEIIIELNRKAMVQLKYNNQQTCFQLLKTAEDILKEKKNFTFKENDGKQKYHYLLSMTLNNLGCYYKKINSPQVALHYLKQALKFEESSDQIDEVSRAGTLLNICAILSLLLRHNESIQYALRAIKILNDKAKEMMDPMKRGIQLIKEEPEGEIEDSERNLRNSVNSESESQHVKKTYVRNIYMTLVIAYYNLGVEYEHLTDLQAAVDSYQNGYNICEQQSGISGDNTQSGYLNQEQNEMPPIAQTLKQNIEDLKKKIDERQHLKEERKLIRNSKRTMQIMLSGFTHRYGSNTRPRNIEKLANLTSVQENYGNQTSPKTASARVREHHSHNMIPKRSSRDHYEEMVQHNQQKILQNQKKRYITQYDELKLHSLSKDQSYVIKPDSTKHEDLLSLEKIKNMFLMREHSQDATSLKRKIKNYQRLQQEQQFNLTAEENQSGDDPIPSSKTESQLPPAIKNKYNSYSQNQTPIRYNGKQIQKYQKLFKIKRNRYKSNERNNQQIMAVGFPVNRSDDYEVDLSDQVTQYNENLKRFMTNQQRFMQTQPNVFSQSSESGYDQLYSQLDMQNQPPALHISEFYNQQEPPSHTAEIKKRYPPLPNISGTTSQNKNKFIGTSRDYSKRLTQSSYAHTRPNRQNYDFLLPEQTQQTTETTQNLRQQSPKKLNQTQDAYQTFDNTVDLMSKVQILKQQSSKRMSHQRKQSIQGSQKKTISSQNDSQQQEQQSQKKITKDLKSSEKEIQAASEQLTQHLSHIHISVPSERISNLKQVQVQVPSEHKYSQKQIQVTNYKSNQKQVQVPSEYSASTYKQVSDHKSPTKQVQVPSEHKYNQKTQMPSKAPSENKVKSRNAQVQSQIQQPQKYSQISEHKMNKTPQKQTQTMTDNKSPSRLIQVPSEPSKQIQVPSEAPSEYQKYNQSPSKQIQCPSEPSKQIQVPSQAPSEYQMNNKNTSPTKQIQCPSEPTKQIQVPSAEPSVYKKPEKNIQVQVETQSPSKEIQVPFEISRQLQFPSEKSSEFRSPFKQTQFPSDHQSLQKQMQFPSQSSRSKEIWVQNESEAFEREIQISAQHNLVDLQIQVSEKSNLNQEQYLGQPPIIQNSQSQHNNSAEKKTSRIQTIQEEDLQSNQMVLYDQEQDDELRAKFILSEQEQASMNYLFSQEAQRSAKRLFSTKDQPKKTLEDQDYTSMRHSQLSSIQDEIHKDSEIISKQVTIKELDSANLVPQSPDNQKMIENSIQKMQDKISYLEEKLNQYQSLIIQNLEQQREMKGHTTLLSQSDKNDQMAQEIPYSVEVSLSQGQNMSEIRSHHTPSVSTVKQELLPSEYQLSKQKEPMEIPRRDKNHLQLDSRLLYQQHLEFDARSSAKTLQKKNYMGIQEEGDMQSRQIEETPFVSETASLVEMKY